MTPIQEEYALNKWYLIIVSSYVGTDGNRYELRYKADKNGFRPIGDHLPHTHREQTTRVRHHRVHHHASQMHNRLGIFPRINR